MAKQSKIEVITHFPKGNLGGDYIDVEVKLDKELIAYYGDNYHDKGTDKADAFVSGLIWGKNWKQTDYKLTHRDVDDR